MAVLLPPSTRPDSRRVVVTGIGLLTCTGVGTAATWDALAAGRGGIAPISLFDAAPLPTRFAGEVRGFAAEDFMDRRESRRLSRFQRFAMAAAEMAVRDAALPDAAGPRAGVIVGSTVGGLGEAEVVAQESWTRGPAAISPFFILQMLGNMAPSYLSLRYGFTGPSWATNSACATGAHAIGEAMRIIQRGDADVMLAGGAEAAITPLGIGGFCAMRALSTRNDDPAGASRPFDADRDGFVMAEGAGVVLLESLDHAGRRGARIYAELAGYGSTADAHHPTTPAPAHDGGQRCMRQALADAALAPADVGYLNAHGSSTPVGDALEAEGIAAVFGEGTGLLVSSTKSMTGHMLGAAGAAEAAISVLALHHALVPPTINLHRPDPAARALDCVPGAARPRTLDAVMSNSFGFGGTNVSLVFTRLAN